MAPGGRVCDGWFKIYWRRGGVGRPCGILPDAPRLLPDEKTPSVLHWVRGENDLHAYFNLTGEPRPLADPRGTLLFTSEAIRYGGQRPDAAIPKELRPYECAVFGPAAWDSPPFTADCDLTRG